jgi:enoyl-CoA hydratase
MSGVDFLTYTFENILFQNNSSVALIVVNREALNNSINRLTISELIKAFNLVKEDSDIRVVILTGSGKNTFIGQIDESELIGLTPQEAKLYSEEGQKLTLLIEQLGKPVIAAINGVAFDAGLEIALACSLRIASSDAQFGFPSIKKGTLPAFGGSRRLTRLVGVGRSLELLLSGKILSTEEACKIGLLSQITRQIELFGEVKDLAQKISNNSPTAIKYLLDSFFNGLEMPLEDAMLLESTLFGLYTKSLNDKFNS